MGIRKTPEQKAALVHERGALRQAEFERQVAERGARDAAEKKAAAEAAALRKAAVARRAEAVLQASSDHGKPIKFSALRVQVFEGTVYTTEGGPRPLGPLPGARASLTMAKPLRMRRSNEGRALRALANMNTAQYTIIEQAALAVSAGGKNHHRQLSGKGTISLARADVERFNTIAAACDSKADPTEH